MREPARLVSCTRAVVAGPLLVHRRALDLLAKRWPGPISRRLGTSVRLNYSGLGLEAQCAAVAAFLAARPDAALVDSFR